MLIPGVGYGRNADFFEIEPSYGKGEEGPHKHSVRYIIAQKKFITNLMQNTITHF